MPASTWSLSTRSHGEVPVRWERSTRHRSTSMRVSREGVTVTAPLGVDRSVIDRFLEQKRAWINDQLVRQGGLNPGGGLLPGTPSTLLWAGEPHSVVWQTAEFPRLDIAAGQLQFWGDWSRPNAAATARGLLRTAMHQHVQRAAAQCLPEFARIMAHAPVGCQVKSSASWWGRMTGKNHMDLEESLAFVPDAIVRYIIAHEMGHLIEKNHSARFWAQVERLDAQYREHDRWIDQKGRAARTQKQALFGES